MLDAAGLTELVCLPRSGGINVQQLRYLRPDGTEVAFAERHSRGFASKLARYTGMDSGKDRAIDLRVGDEPPFLRVTCKTRSSTTGVFAELEQPIGTAFGTIGVGGRRLTFDLSDGRRVGEVVAADDPRGPHALRADGTPFGAVALSLPGQEELTLLDLATDSVLIQHQGTPAWVSGVTAVQLQLDPTPAEPLRTFVLAVPIAIALGHRSTSWATEDA